MKNNSTKAKNLELRDGRRITLTFDTATWQAVELLASAAGQRWTNWVRDLLAGNPHAANMHAVVRAAAVDGLLTHQVIQERADQLTQPTAPMLTYASTLDDDQLREELAAGVVVGGPIDLGGFSVSVGADMHGRACTWITNGMRDGLHYALPLPITLAEIAARVEGDRS